MPLIFASLLLLVSCTAFASPQGRFFLEGDGQLKIVNAKTGQGGQVRYRTADGRYEGEAVDRLFGVPVGSSEGMAFRFIALLDYLQDTLKGGTIRIVSGYRSPQYNEGLRKKGRLAARTSMHIEGMAADIEMEGIDPKTLWEKIRGLDCCGAGFYHGKGVHVDVGPSRFWDETSTKVDQDLGAHNKLILLRTDRDRYHPGETVRLTLHRITDYPFGVRPEATVLKDSKEWKKIQIGSLDGECVMIPDRKAARNLSWSLPQDVAPKEKLVIVITFCHKPVPEMPERTDSNPFEIAGQP